MECSDTETTAPASPTQRSVGSALRKRTIGALDADWPAAVIPIHRASIPRLVLGLSRQPNAVDVMFALRVAHRLGLPGAAQAPIDQASGLLVQAQRVRRSILDQTLALATSPLVAREFGQAVEALAQQAANRLAPFDERFAGLLDEVSWPGAHAAAGRPARRLASNLLAHGLLMATGCAGGTPGARPPVDAQAHETIRLVFPDGPIRAAMDMQPLPHESCTTDGGQNVSLDASCDEYVLGDAVTRATDGGCMAMPTTYDPSCAVVIDCEGRAVELLHLPDNAPLLTADTRQAWLDSLANDRWPCFAGQSVQFGCVILLLP